MFTITKFSFSSITIIRALGEVEEHTWFSQILQIEYDDNGWVENF
jgi:hypothetical protein